MKKIMLVVCAAVLAVLWSSPVSAQVSAGVNEIGVRGYVESGKFDGEERATALDFNGYYGRFITDRVAIGPAFNIYKLEGEAASGAVNGFVDYHFGDTSKTVVPFVEGAAGVFYNEDDKPLYLAVGPGVKWFFGSGGGALNANAFYRRIVSDTMGANDFFLSVGVSVFFGR